MRKMEGSRQWKVIQEGNELREKGDVSKMKNRVEIQE